MTEAATEAGGRDEVDGLELVVMTADGSRRIALPRGGVVTIGRAEGQRVRLDDASISRAHAALHVGSVL